MAQRQKNKKPKVKEAEREQPTPEPSEVAEDALARTSDAPSADEDEDEEKAGAEEDESSAEAAGGEEKAADAESDALARVDEQGDEQGEGAEDDAPAAAQLGTERYVLAGFFASGMLLAYVLGRAVQTLWMSASNKDWFSQAVPRLAAVPDEDKSTYGLLVGGVIALVVILRAYRRPDLRAWTDEVASELGKVKWPDRKEVQSSTFIVIATSAVATLYLALLDRFWAFVTNIVYGGDGS